MSYCRWGWDGSDVYIFESVYGAVECCGCPLGGQQGWTDVAGFLDHLDQHVAEGHVVPVDVAWAIFTDWEAGSFADWDTTDPAAMEVWRTRFAGYKQQDTRSTAEAIRDNPQMFGSPEAAERSAQIFERVAAESARRGEEGSG